MDITIPKITQNQHHPLVVTQELNIGPELYAFKDGYCRPEDTRVGGVVIEDGKSHLRKAQKISN